jgi:hypothetical protein
MHALIPNEWYSCPPEVLVAGDGSYAAALALVMGSKSLRLDCLRAGLGSNETGGYLRVLDNVHTLVLVVSHGMSSSEALWHHQWLWDWVVKLTRGKNCHEIRFVFVLEACVSEEFDHAIAAGLAAAVLDLKTCGYSIWRQSGTLVDLLALIAQIARKDNQDLKWRLDKDVRVKSLRAFLAARSDDDDKVWTTAVHAVAAAFRDESGENKDGDLDLFCTSPCHTNGNLLRQWLRFAVTEPVTPDMKKQGKELISLIRLDVLNT